MRKLIHAILGAIVALASMQVVAVSASAAVPDVATNLGAIPANTSLYAGMLMPKTGTRATSFTIEATTSNSLSAPTVASCTGSLTNGGVNAPIPRCTITGLSNSTAYFLRGYTANAEGTSQAVMSSWSYQPTAAAKIIRAEVPCDTAGWVVSPCSSSTSDTLIKVFGQGLQNCSAITATGGNSPSTPIPVTPNLAGTEITFLKPAAPYGWTSFDCVGTISSFLGSGISRFNSPTMTYSSTNVATGDEITVTAAWATFVNVSSVTVGGTSATYNVLDYNTMLVTIPNGLSSGAKDVTVTNISGAGTKTAALTVSSGVSAPGTPGTPTAVSGNATATVTVVAPSSGGNPATYTVTASPGGATCTVTVPATSCNVSGLSNGTSYTFAATATNTGGTSGSSVSSAAVTPSTVPGAPTIGSITAGDQQLSVPFTAPGSNGGASITNYKYSIDNGSSWTSAGSTSSPGVITGLTNGSSYSVKLRAVNSIGDGTASTAVSATPLALQPQSPSYSAPSTPTAPTPPPSSVESLKVVQALGNKGSVLKVMLEQQKDATVGTTVIVKIFNLLGQKIQELNVPVNAEASSFELPINLKIGEFTVEAQTVNASSSSPAVATLPTFAPKSFFTATRGSNMPILSGKKISSPIVFNPNSSKLTVAAKISLLQIAEKIVKSNSRVALTGFTASANQGKKIEQKLATARALEVAKYLKSKGIQKWIYFAGFGALNQNTPSNQARKVELRLIK
jgi:outer membrane protein OmpA-like peptidoglycan-associated protein